LQKVDGDASFLALFTIRYAVDDSDAWLHLRFRWETLAALAHRFKKKRLVFEVLQVHDPPPFPVKCTGQTSRSRHEARRKVRRQTNGIGEWSNDAPLAAYAHIRPCGQCPPDNLARGPWALPFPPTDVCSTKNSGGYGRLVIDFKELTGKNDSCPKDLTYTDDGLNASPNQGAKHGSKNQRE